MPNRRPLAERLAEKTRRDASGCWIWTGAVNRGNYGVIGSGIGKQTIIASRAAWLVHRGSIPADMFVLHTCDNPRCVNPRHLFLGTLQDNMDDMKRKNRSGAGERHGMSKLSADQVAAIRTSSLQQKELAKIYRVTQSTISSVRSGDTWRSDTP